MGVANCDPLSVRYKVCLRSILAPTVKRPILAAQTLHINNHGVVSMWMSATDSQGEDTHHLAMGAAKGNTLCVRCNMCLRLLLVPTVKRSILAAQTLLINNDGVDSMWMSATDSHGGKTLITWQWLLPKVALCVCDALCACDGS